MTPTTLALCYTALAALPATMHLALAAGAPLGQFTVGGRFSGRLPPRWRVCALVQAAILFGLACIVLDHAGLVALDLPAPAFWVAVGITLLTTLANIATPSRPERLLWGPVTTGMTLAVLGVALL